MEKKKHLRDLYCYPGFRGRATMKPHPEDSNGWIITLDRRQKKQFVQFAAQRHAVFGIEECIGCGTWMPEQRTSTLSLNIVGWIAHSVEP
jgi:succinate dehydrogenase/fumarate reductase-like Fe-S protein